MINKDWMKEAAREIVDLTDIGEKYVPDLYATIDKHCPMKRDVAYMEVPRCEFCKHWGKPISNMKGGVCNILSRTFDPFGQVIRTPENFGCVRWEAR